MGQLQPPLNWGTVEVELFADYLRRWPAELSHIHDQVIETWIYRHWREFQLWLPLNPLEWKYELVLFTNEQALSISHVGDWMDTLTYWGDDLFDGLSRKETWLGRSMLELGTTPAPIIVAQHAKGWRHPRENGKFFIEPLQLVEGHLRLAYLQALIRRKCSSLKESHQVLIATLPVSPLIDRELIG